MVVSSSLFLVEFVNEVGDGTLASSSGSFNRSLMKCEDCGWKGGWTYSTGGDWRMRVVFFVGEKLSK